MSDLVGETIVLASPALLPSAGADADPITRPINPRSSRVPQSPPRATSRSTPNAQARRGGLTPAQADAVLLIAADTLDDLERARIALENRLRTLIRDDEHGKGVNPLLPAVRAQQSLLEDVQAAEHEATLQLQRAMRAHPLGPWVQVTKGVGLKQAARLLAVIGDPADRDRPSQLWSYCGYSVLRVAHGTSDAQCGGADADVLGRQGIVDPHSSCAADPSIPGDQRLIDAQGHHVVGVAPSRRRGQKANWNAAAKMRAFLVAESCIKNRLSPYRDVYDQGRAKYADAVHQVECVRCGPAGRPAPVGSPLSLGHQHARALRLVAKAVLLDLWREARRVRYEDVAA